VGDIWESFGQRWEAFQSVYVPHRELQFALMLEYVCAILGREPGTVLDAACGPGSLARAALAAFDTVQVTGLDIDPFLIELGQRTMPSPRMRWVHADLRHPRWPDVLAPACFDAVLTSTASHWLEPDVLRRFYVGVHRLMRPGAVFANADIFPQGDSTSQIARTAMETLFRWQSSESARRGETWATFWGSVEATPDFRPLVERRRELLGNRPPRVFLRGADHVVALRDAGFCDVQEVWRWHSAAVIVARAGQDPASGRPAQG
jgi:SAM-dependent methyltransferase